MTAPHPTKKRKKRLKGILRRGTGFCRVGQGTTGKKTIGRTGTPLEMGDGRRPMPKKTRVKTDTMAKGKKKTCSQSKKRAKIPRATPSYNGQINRTERKQRRRPPRPGKFVWVLKRGATERRAGKG